MLVIVLFRRKARHGLPGRRRGGGQFMSTPARRRGRGYVAPPLIAVALAGALTLPGRAATASAGPAVLPGTHPAWATAAANPEIYQADQQPGRRAFRDITDHPGGQTYAAAIGGGLSGGAFQGALFTLGSDWTLHAVPGYDTVTGVGSPTPGYLESQRRP
jgi:hypothetical protein